MNTRRVAREGEAAEHQEDNANEEERDNLTATLRGQGETLTAIQKALLQGQATQDKVVEMLAMLPAERNQGRQTTGSPATERADEDNTVTPTEGAPNATEGPETAINAQEGRRGQLFTGNFETGATTGVSGIRPKVV